MKKHIETLINNALMRIEKCRTRILFQTYPAYKKFE